MQEQTSEILNELKLNLGEKYFNDYLKIKDFHQNKKFQIKAWLNEDAMEAGEYETIDMGLPFEDAILSAIQSVKNDDYICSEIISEEDDELDYLFEAMIENNIFKCRFTSKAWENETWGIIINEIVCSKDKSHKEFLTTAHVVQNWKVDSDGGFLSVRDDCVKVAYDPNIDIDWKCAICGAKAITRGKIVKL